MTLLLSLLRYSTSTRHTPGFCSTLVTWAARYRQRLDLAELDDDRLRDIGISRHAAQRECAKPFWQA
ncbi:MAG TPA: DUF1127 domain-containing protein [Mesorhizobium sp.]|jgi:uncharacterized protein YjiS (DUF1127 family)